MENKRPEFRKWSLFPKPLTGLIEPLTRPVLKAKGLAGSRILTEWHNIVGAALSEHCMPEKLSFPPGKKVEGTLVIAVESGFATQLQMMQPVLLERLATYFGYKAISRITIAHTYAKAKPKVVKPERVGKMTLDTAALTAGIEDPELKAAIMSFATTLSGGGDKKGN